MILALFFNAQFRYNCFVQIGFKNRKNYLDFKGKSNVAM
jgi:hypothetical protein